MSDRERAEDADPLEEIVPAGAGGQLLVPSDNSIFGPDDEPAPNTLGVNEGDVSDDDDGLLDPGASPEFDHSLRRRPAPDAS